MNSRRESLRVVFALATFGVLGLCSMLARPSLATLRVVDFMHLIGTGMCLGGAVVAFAWARSKWSVVSWVLKWTGDVLLRN